MSPVWLSLTVLLHALYFGPSPGGLDGKESACNVGDLGLIPGVGNGNSLQYACLGNSVDRGAWLVTVRGVAQSRT